MRKQLFTIAVLSGALMAAGCAKEEYVKPKFTDSASAVGVRYLPAKVDILMVTDNTGSTNNIYDTLNSQLVSFASNMQSKFWDFHVGAVSIVNQPRTISRVLVNPKFNTDTLADGTPVPNAAIVPSDRAETNPAAFQLLAPPQATGSGDQTYQVMLDTLNSARADTYTNYLRADAPLAVIVVTNGYEATVTDTYGTLLSTGNARLDSVKTQLVNMKNGLSQLVRFYPISAFGAHDTNPSSGLTPCLGGAARPGTAYINMLSRLAGVTTELCDSNALNNVLSNIEANLEIVRQSYVYSNIVLEEEPVESSIRVFKNGAEIPQGTNNGFEYKGFGTVYTVTGIRADNGTITALNPGLNRRTGYVIQLNGTARMIGSDVPDLEYEKR